MDLFDGIRIGACLGVLWVLFEMFVSQPSAQRQQQAFAAKHEEDMYQLYLGSLKSPNSSNYGKPAMTREKYKEVSLRRKLREAGIYD